MIEEIHVNDGGKGGYRIFKSRDFEKINPIDHYSKVFTVPQISMERELLLNKFPNEWVEDFLTKRAAKEWEKKYDEILKTVIPANFLAVLEAKSKKEQVRLLKNQTINLDQLIAFIIRSYLDYNYLFSEYQAEHMHNGLGNEVLPRLAHFENDKIDKIGKTTLSDGQLKQLIQHRKVVVAKFFDRGENWHCFFLTFKSLRREESWQNGQPHFHYISDKFGLNREEVVSSLKSKYYNLGSLPHIALVGYR